MRILLELSYLGTGFSGYQVQPGKATVQAALQDAIEKIYGSRLDVKGCSRTDAGVHALQYFATFDADREIPVGRIPAALNSVIDRRVAIRSACIVPDGFHVRHGVLKKEYEYLINTAVTHDPFLEGRCWQYGKAITDEGIARMKIAAEAFIGKHDFSGFMSAGSDIADRVRDIKHLEIIRDGELVRIRVCADGFLYNMVRIMVGTLTDVARGKLSPEDMGLIIESRDRSRAGVTAPPEGLYLRRVWFLDGAIK